MSSKIFLKVGNIKGESTDEKHKEQIEVFNWSWGVTNAATGVPAVAVQPAGQLSTT